MCRSERLQRRAHAHASACSASCYSPYACVRSFLRATRLRPITIYALEFSNLRVQYEYVLRALVLANSTYAYKYSYNLLP